MALKLLEVLRKGLKILKNCVKAKKEALQARLVAEKKSTSSRDERWLDHNANLVDKQQVPEASENAPDHEHNIHNTSLADPVCTLINYLQEVRMPENLAPFLRSSIGMQQGPHDVCTYDVTYTFYSVTIGTGFSSSISSAKEIAATQALQYLHANGIPDGSSTHPVRRLRTYLTEVQMPENLATFLLSSVASRRGPRDIGIYDFTYTFHGVTIGTGAGTSRDSAEKIAATKALQYLRANGIPDDPDPVRGLSNYLQAARFPENLIPYLRFASVQSGPNSKAMYHATYTFCDVVVGRGSSTAMDIAKRNAAVQALQYFRTHGMPPIPELRTMLISVG